ncbi:peroxiredoxin [Melghirimyces profundicolus]|uniref:Peroxiredoxin n=1 Tax=Melghirimyces profundicolus TaxID=1242148 RepID=A0A2T6C9T8_9BACL|nr:TlpA disulfide reductase family protein [Melghirimyces profundicolus]PTX65074.1 peroxiredoxin [Melghirimyces profundicolus]
MGYRSIWRNILVAVVIVAAVAGAVWTAADRGDQDQTASDSPSSGQVKQGESSRDEQASEGFRAPDFTLKTLDGKTVRLSDNGGKPSIINLWASWCPPCKVEMPHIQEAYEKYGDRVNFYMVNLTSLDNKDKMKKYVEKEGFTFPVLLDETGEVGERYQAFSIPQTYVVSEKGEIIEKIAGAMSKEQLEEMMKKLTS